VKVKATLIIESRLFNQQEIIVSINNKEDILKVQSTIGKATREFTNKVILIILKVNI
jgi:hypothetical protein